MTTAERNEAFIDIVCRHNDELRTFLRELIDEMDTLTRDPENSYVVHIDPANPPPPTSATGELSRLNETP